MPSPLLPTRRRSRARQYAIYPRKKSLGENRRPFSPPRWNTLGTRTRLGFLIRACASRKIPVEPVDYERANRSRKLDPGGGRVYTRTPSFSLSLSVAPTTGSRLLHLEELLHTLGANNSWPRGTRPAERLPYSPPFVRGQGRFPSPAFVRIPLLSYSLLEPVHVSNVSCTLR